MTRTMARQWHHRSVWRSERARQAREIETFEKRLEEAEPVLRVRFTRIAQLQADLDTLRANRRANG